MKKIRFIINPNSGTIKKAGLPALIQSTLDSKNFEYEICFTKAPGHATELAREAVENLVDIVVAVGGDGSVNETAVSLCKTKTVLGIIPTGSGNGLARHLGIPVDLVRAIETINTGKTETIDTLKVNDHFCIATIGLGFDAHIAHLFSQAKKRGYSTYIKLVLKEFATFKEKKFSFFVDGNTYVKDCFVLTFANCSQFGNDAVIAPAADLKDGIIDISIIKKFPVFSAPMLIYRLLNNAIDRSMFFEALRGKEILVKNNETIYGHIDGEPVIFNSDLHISVNPLSVGVIVPTIKI